jgi:hypothetical protein
VIRGVRRERVARAVSWFIPGLVVGFTVFSAGIPFESLRQDLQVQIRQLTPWVRGETKAIGTLKTIAMAESIFREGDKDGNGALDYASLAQLGQAQLIDAELASGTKDGYVFEAAASTSTSEFLWFATARPLRPGWSGERYFETNHAAVIFYTTAASFALNTTDCRIGVPCPDG